MTEMVLVTTETETKCRVYHTEECQRIEWSDGEEIELGEAQRRGLTECSFCSGTAYVQGPAEKLLEMDVDDVDSLGGGKA